MDLYFALLTFFLINYMMDPIGNVPAFISIIKEDRRRKAVKYLLICLIIILSFAFIANLLFKLFGIAIKIFRIVAGILLVILGIKMIFLKHRELRPLPFIISLYAGPGVITTTIYMLSKADGLEEEIFVYITVFLAILFSWICIALYERYKKYFEGIIKYAINWKALLLIIFGTYFIIDAIF